MDKNGRVAFYLIFICTIVINITTVINGAQKHETWRIIIGSVLLGLMLAAGIIALVKTYRQKSKQVS
jgi:RsiW-degrading membrane proteinase PrsW (M82 family)